MLNFAKIVNSDSKVRCNISGLRNCKFFNNFCKVKMLGLEYSKPYLTVASRS